MLAQLLPASVAAVETRVDDADIHLYPEEEDACAKAVAARRREFTTGRACARRALAQLGVAPVAVPSGEHGEPLWPAGVVGSITHCCHYRACAVARDRDLSAIGIDAELLSALPAGVLEAVASRRERERLAWIDEQIPADTVLFSAKEAVYKAWFPLTRRSLHFEDVDLSLDPERRTFRARLLVPGPVVGGRRLSELLGQWRVEGGVVVAATVVGPDRHPRGRAA